MIALLTLLLPQRVPSGEARSTLIVRGVPIRVFTYKPRRYDGRRMVLVFHGVERDAEDYRDAAKGMAERLGALIVAPEFDRARFPARRYHRGGVLDESGRPTPSGRWTYLFVPEIADAVRRWEGRATMPYALIGHSAGGQFLGRMAGLFPDHGATRIVVANPSAYLFPTRDVPYGYGFGGLPEPQSSDAAIRRYLAQPLTLYLGTADAGDHPQLDRTPEAKAQGAGRLQRGRSAFAAARKLAQARNWRFGWRLVETPGVGHNHAAMFDAPEAARTLEP